MEILYTLLNIDPNYIIIGLFVVFFTFEQILNTPFKFDKRPKHFFHNFLFQILFVIANYFFAIFVVFSVEWLNDHNIGLLYLFDIPFWPKLIIGVLLYDVTTYWIHRATHKIPLLWRFHRVHHSDTSVDSSTFFRFHPIELILVFGIGNILTVLLFGTDLLSMALYYLILNIFVFFEHSNLYYPYWLDKTFGWIITTPNLHKVHHEQTQFYTDSNFADIFILWDRLFGTYKYLPVENINYGLKEFDEDKKQTFQYLILSPFINIKRITSEKAVNSDQ
ncbi:MAG TPA: sterol desaturase family protein [Ignavibacteriaceae bacterium]|jgi:sterol desaturase/sphingolipid hydroxylase (fatty acid hydroxylase superfamily)